MGHPSCARRTRRRYCQTLPHSHRGTPSEWSTCTHPTENTFSLKKWNASNFCSWFISTTGDFCTYAAQHPVQVQSMHLLFLHLDPTLCHVLSTSSWQYFWPVCSSRQDKALLWCGLLIYLQQSNVHEFHQYSVLWAFTIWCLLCITLSICRWHEDTKQQSQSQIFL